MDGFLSQTSPRRETSSSSSFQSILSPTRNSRMQQSQMQHVQQQQQAQQSQQAYADDQRTSMPRRFTTDSSGTATLSSFRRYPVEHQSDYQQSLHQHAQQQSQSQQRQGVSLIDQKRQEYERIRDQRQRFERQMKILEEQQRQEAEALLALESEMSRVGHSSEPTTPPEYHSSSGFPSSLSRPNRYSTSTIISPPGFGTRSARSGSQLASPPGAMMMNSFGFDSRQSGIPSRSVPITRRNSDDEKDEAVRQDPSSRRSTNALNRYSMPVTRNKADAHHVLDQNNTERFLFGDEEDPGFVSAHAFEERNTPTPTLNRRNGDHSMSSFALDLAQSGSSDLEAYSQRGWNSTAHHHRPQQSLSSLNSLSSNANREVGSFANRSSSHRNSADLRNLTEENDSSLAPHIASPPRLQSSYSSNEVHTLKTNHEGMTPNMQNANNHAQQHFHHHNASMGRIPAGIAPTRGSHSRELSSDSNAGASREQVSNYQSFNSVLHANAPSFSSMNSSAAPIANPLMASTSGGLMNNFPNGFYPQNGYANGGLQSPYGSNNGNQTLHYNSNGAQHGNGPQNGNQGNFTPTPVQQGSFAPPPNPQGGFTPGPGQQGNYSNINMLAAGFQQMNMNGVPGGPHMNMGGMPGGAQLAYNGQGMNGYQSGPYNGNGPAVQAPTHQPQPQPQPLRDSQTRVMQSRRQQDSEAMSRYQNMPLESFRDQIYSLCKDQHGCRYLQKKLEERIPEQVHMIWAETNEHVIELMMDPFGNYLCQKLLEFCNDDERTRLIENAAKDMSRIALDQHGTRALQKMIEHVSTPPQVHLITEALRHRVVELIQDLNGNHVIQKCLNKFGKPELQFIMDAVGQRCIEVGTHRHGCCVLQRCIDHADATQKPALIARITENARRLVQDPFGNYVVQYIIDLNEPRFTEPIVSAFSHCICDFSCHKFSSNVIEKCLRCAKAPSKDLIVNELLSSGRMESLLKDSFANYVIQTALDFATPNGKKKLVEAIRPFLPAIRGTPHGRRIQTKVTAFDSQAVSANSSGQTTPADRTQGQIPLRQSRNTGEANGNVGAPFRSSANTAQNGGYQNNGASAVQPPQQYQQKSQATHAAGADSGDSNGEQSQQQTWL